MNPASRYVVIWRLESLMVGSTSKTLETGGQYVHSAGKATHQI